MTVGLLVTTVALADGPQASAASKKKRAAAAKPAPVITTAPERPTTPASLRIAALTSQLGRSIGVKVTAPTCPAGVRTDKPVEYSCVVGFDGTIVSFFVRSDPSGDGELITSSAAIIPTGELNRAAGPGASCSKGKVVIGVAGTEVLCTLGKGRQVSITISPELADAWTIESTTASGVTTTLATTTTRPTTTVVATTLATTTLATTTRPASSTVTTR
jgi:hypothetical protein